MNALSIALATIGAVAAFILATGIVGAATVMMQVDPSDKHDEDD